MPIVPQSTPECTALFLAGQELARELSPETCQALLAELEQCAPTARCRQLLAGLQAAIPQVQQPEETEGQPDGSVERWRPIAGFPAYQVSDQGRVHSSRRYTWHILKPGKLSSGRACRRCLSGCQTEGDLVLCD
jgi:hypothetical protein